MDKSAEGRMAKRTSSLFCSFFVNPCPLLYPLFLSCITAALCDASYAPEDILRVCGYTRFPGLCADAVLSRRQSTLGGDDFAGVAYALVDRITEELNPVTYMFSLKSSENSGARREATEYCNDLMRMSFGRLNQSMYALETAPAEKKGDIQTWLTAVQTFQETCKDSLRDIASPLYRNMERLSALSSNALAIANRLPEVSQMRYSRRHTSEERFPTWVSNIDRRVLTNENIKATAVVAADGSGDFTSIQDAITSTSSQDGRCVIFVKAGVYKEKLSITRDDVMLVGQGKHLTTITFNSSVKNGASMPGSATVVVIGDRFMAKNIAFVNSAGPSGGQALALRILSDQAVLFRCSIRGYQDTLYAHAFRQFYRDCDIHGTVDFIFGNAAAVFQNCKLVLRRPKPGGYNVIMASGRADPYQNSGFVVQNCRVQASSGFASVRHSIKSYLGRPWKKYARTVVMESFVDDSIHPRGWVEKSGEFATRTLFFAEGLNTGPGAGTSSRVEWPGFHVVSAGECSEFTVSRFIQGSSWLPARGVAYDPGLYPVSSR